MTQQEKIVQAFNCKIIESGVKQKAIAQKAQITEDRLSRILSSKSKMLAEEFLKLCFILNVDPRTFTS